MKVRHRKMNPYAAHAVGKYWPEKASVPSYEDWPSRNHSWVQKKRKDARAANRADKKRARHWGKELVKQAIKEIDQ